MSGLASKMAQEPSLAEFCSLCEQAAQSSQLKHSSSYSLEIFSVVLENKLVPLFIDDKQGLNALKTLFHSPAGLGCLVSRLRVGTNSDAESIFQLLLFILESPGLPSLLSVSKSETVPLIWGSRLLNVTSSNSRAGTANASNYLENADKYSKWLARNMIKENVNDPILFDKGVKLGSPKSFVEPWLSYTEKLSPIISQLRASQLQFMLSHALIGLLPSQPSEAARVLVDLKIDTETVLDICHKLPANVSVIRSAIVLAREQGNIYEVTLRLVNQWANKTRIVTSPLLNQQSLVQCLIGSCPSLSTEQASSIVHSSVFTEGVTNHISSTSTGIRSLGTLVAETFAKRAGTKLEFGVTYSGYEWWIGYDNLDEASPVTADSLSSLQKILVGEDSPQENQNAISERAGAVDLGDSDDADSDVEVDPPFYLKDLIAYLRSDKYEEVVSALEHGSLLILRKASFGSEVSHYAEETISSACSLSDKFSINRFSELRQSILNAVLIADPSQASVVVNLLITGDWSLAQRQSLLASLVYAAHTLAKGEHLGKHELLPSALHNLFISGEDKLGIEVNNGQARSLGSTEKILEVAELGNSAKIVRRSKRLDQTKKQTASQNKFSKVSDRFFFPLLAAQPPLRRSSYDSILYAQWLRTLAVIIVEAYPTSHMPVMVNEMWNLLNVLVGKMELYEDIVQEAIYACFGMVISVGAGIIGSHHAVGLGRVYDQLVASIGVFTNASPQTQAVVRASLAQVAHLVEQVNNKFLGEQS